MPDAVIPAEGWGVLHLFFKVDHAAVAELPPGAGKELADALTGLAGEVQLHCFAALGHKADLMVMALDEDLTALRRVQTAIASSSAAPALRLDWSYLSLTETSEYTATPEQYREEMSAKGVEGEDLDRRVAEFAERMATYNEHKLHPAMPAWELACFYPMSHRREG
ncbi:MAG: chlorite dismutase family protein, partial [Actinobacteria bacterium]|nr:chlorite dismutase family protein [Actinomycetota bacterium]